MTDNNLHNEHPKCCASDSYTFVLLSLLYAYACFHFLLEGALPSTGCGIDFSIGRRASHEAGWEHPQAAAILPWWNDVRDEGQRVGGQENTSIIENIFLWPRNGMQAGRPFAGPLAQKIYSARPENPGSRGQSEAVAMRVGCHKSQWRR